MLSPRPLFLAALIGLAPLSALAADPTPPAADIRTPSAPPQPRINGPRVYGARPGHPFFYHLPVTGERPMNFTAKVLPPGLAIDPATGNVTGTATARGAFPIEFAVANARGTDAATLSIVIGDTICLTPPLGWNSWNHFGNHVTDKDVRAAADALVNSGLVEHGWTYVNVDDCWQGERDAQGNIHGNAKFPDMKALADYVHGKGLKFGLYSSPGPKTCAGFEGSYEHEDQDARTYAEWGVDYVKYDLCSYWTPLRHCIYERTAALFPEDERKIFNALNVCKAELPPKDQRTPEQEKASKALDEEIKRLTSHLDAAKLKTIETEENQAPYRVFGQSLTKVPRDIVYSLCQYGNADVWEWAAALNGNCWRTTGDIKANWQSMSKIGFGQDRLAKFAGPGHWNDPDMLEIGNAGLTPDECYTHMTLWAMLSAPLLIGCDLSKMDPLTVSLFSNDEVLAVDQDSSGKQGHRIKADGNSEVWVKSLDNGGIFAVAFFNRGDTPTEIKVSWRDLPELPPEFSSMHDRIPMRDLWRQTNRVFNSQDLKVVVAPHSAELLSSRIVTPF